MNTDATTCYECRCYGIWPDDVSSWCNTKHKPQVFSDLLKSIWNKTESFEFPWRDNLYTTSLCCIQTLMFFSAWWEMAFSWAHRGLLYDFTTIWATARQNQQNNVCPVKTQISLRIHTVWPDSSLSAWRTVGSLSTHRVHSEYSDQSGWMPRLIWVYAGRTCHIVGFVVLRLIYLYSICVGLRAKLRYMSYFSSLLRPLGRKIRLLSGGRHMFWGLGNSCFTKLPLVNSVKGL